MKQNIRKEIVKSMDSVRFTQEEKNVMVLNLMAAYKQPVHAVRSRRLLIIAAAAVMLIAMLTGAAVFTRWTDSINTAFRATQDNREYAENIGLSALPEKIISATDNGITITAAQTIVDPYRAKLVFRIEGFSLPEGEAPALVGGVVSIDGKSDGFWDIQTGGFFNGIMVVDNQNLVYTDGTPIQLDSQGNLLCRYTDEHGALEYEINLHFCEPGAHLDKQIEVHFSELGLSSGNAENTLTVEGDWTMSWTLSGTKETIIASPNLEIGSTGHTLMEAEATPITLRAIIQTKDYFKGWEELENFSPKLAGVQYRDGSVSLCASPSEEGYLDTEKLLYRIEMRTDRILDPEQISGLVFLEYPEGTEEPIAHIIPIA